MCENSEDKPEKDVTPEQKKPDTKPQLIREENIEYFSPACYLSEFQDDFKDND